MVKFWKSQILGVLSCWNQMTIYIGYIQKKNVINFVRTSGMIIIYTSIGNENDCFEGQIMKNWKFKILGVVDQWAKTIISLDNIWQKKL